MDMTPQVPPTPEDIRAEPCTHCEAQPGAPCVTVGEPGRPPWPGFHGQRTHAAVRKRLRAEVDAMLAEPPPAQEVSDG